VSSGKKSVSPNRKAVGEKFQIASNEQQTNHNDQISKCQTRLGHWILLFGIYLEFACPPFFWRGACILLFGINYRRAGKP
jgi:hypothetical protein